MNQTTRIILIFVYVRLENEYNIEVAKQIKVVILLKNCPKFPKNNEKRRSFKK